MRGVPKQRWRVRESLAPHRLAVEFFQVGRGWAHYAVVPVDDFPAWCAARDIHPVPEVEPEPPMRPLGEPVWGSIGSDGNPRTRLLDGLFSRVYNWFDSKPFEWGKMFYPADIVGREHYQSGKGRYFPWP